MERTLQKEKEELNIKILERWSDTKTMINDVEHVLELE